jgi:hypothetical protein
MKFFCDVIIKDLDWMSIDLKEMSEDTGCPIITLIDDSLEDNCKLLEFISYDALHVEYIVAYLGDLGTITEITWYEEHTDTYGDYLEGEVEGTVVENIEDYCKTKNGVLFEVSNPCYGRYVPKTKELLVLVSK